MGCYDTLIDERGHDWQTKAFGRGLKRFHVGDPVDVPGLPDAFPSSFQVEILGEPERHLDFVDSFARVVGGLLVSIDEPRDVSLPLVGYGGNVIAGGA